MCFIPTVGYQTIVQSPSSVCMYVLFLFGLHITYKICSLIDAKIFLVGSLIETMRLSALFANSLLHVYLILRNLVSK